MQHPRTDRPLGPTGVHLALPLGRRPETPGFGSGRDTASLRSKWRTPSEASCDGVGDCRAPGCGPVEGETAPCGGRGGARAQRASPAETPREGDGEAVTAGVGEPVGWPRRAASWGRGLGETRRELAEPVWVPVVPAARARALSL